MAKRTTADHQSPGGESVQGYFRRLLREDPQLIHGKSNRQLLDRWAADHPGQEVSNRVRQGLSNAKSLLKRQGRQRGRRKADTVPHPIEVGVSPRAAPRKGSLDRLEEQIDECLILARRLDREGLEGVISLLRRARNAVVWLGGQ